MSAGLVTLPYALSRGGWLSLVLLFLISIITFYTAILLKKCMDSDPSITSYLDIAERAFGKTARIVVLIILSTELYLVAVGLIILESDSLYKLFPKFRIKLGSLFICGRQSFVLVTALITLPTMLITEMSILSYVSATGVFCCLIIVGSIVCVGAFGGVGFHASGDLLNGGPSYRCELDMQSPLQYTFLCEIKISSASAKGLILSHPLISKLEQNPIEPNKRTVVVFFSFLLVTITCMVTAVTGYLMYGDGVELQITLNLPTTEVSARVAIYTILLIPIAKYALMVTPVANAIEGGLPEDYKNWRSVKLLIRMALLVSSTVVAYVFPYYETLMAIVGSLFTVSVSFILPCMCYLKLSACYRSGNYKLLGSVGIIAFGTLFSKFSNQSMWSFIRLNFITWPTLKICNIQQRKYHSLQLGLAAFKLNELIPASTKVNLEKFRLKLKYTV
ncbi:Transmembrane amino acid transporter family protein [Prunus dulcis]|uniref:Transmembrane amino acid transporter family protein n=1 Tax=Prunus dulcis TaxID=3755 RepID=A0A5H2Y8D9_PRUDU|nr:Transmembrane amino acid transporter family protein [Prunus dulcis]